MRRRVVRVEANRLLELGARLAVLARARRRARPGCCAARRARGSPAPAAGAGPALRRCGRGRPGSPTSGTASARPSAAPRARGRRARARPPIWPAWCRRVTSLSSSASRGAGRHRANTAQRSSPAAKILNCIDERARDAASHTLIRAREDRYTESIVGYAHDAESPSRRAARRGGRCEAGPRCMTLRIHNTLTRATERFTPIEPGHVRLYVCGITIYDLCHMGHARFMIAFDVVQRWLKTLGYRVTYVRNITDIDDKIIRRALERGIGIRALTDEMIAALQQDADALGLERPTHQPRATEYVPQMLDMIGTLEAQGPRLSRLERRRQFRGAQVPRLRQAVGQVARPAARRRARRRARRQGRPARLRDVEVGQGERARRRQVAEPVRRRPARLAHRMLGDVQGARSASTSTSTAAARTCSSRTTRTRSRRARARAAARSSTSGCTTAC